MMFWLKRRIVVVRRGSWFRIGESVVHGAQNCVWYLNKYGKFMRGWWFHDGNAAFWLCENGMILKFLTSTFFLGNQKRPNTYYMYIFISLFCSVNSPVGHLPGFSIKNFCVFVTYGYNIEFDFFGLVSSWRF